MRNAAGAKRPSLLTGTTPVPNQLLDEVMPLLSDTQLRVLLVVVRATLGWQQGSGRKDSDWLSHRQLQARTGRSSAVVSRAIDGLVKRGIVRVTDAVGEPLLTAKARSRVHGRLFFGLVPPSKAVNSFLVSDDEMDQGVKPLAGAPSADDHAPMASKSKANADSNGLAKTDDDNSKGKVTEAQDTTFGSETRQQEAASERWPQKPGTTKETGTKEKKNSAEKVITLPVPTSLDEVSHVPLSDLERAGDGEQNLGRMEDEVLFGRAPLQLPPARFEQGHDVEAEQWMYPNVESTTLENGLEITPEMRSFLLAFERAYDAARDGEKPPPLDPNTYTLLQCRLQHASPQELEAWLPAFFESSFGYVRRRGWSLQSYLESLTILQTACAARRSR